MGLLRFLGLSFVFFHDVLIVRVSIWPHIVLLYFFFVAGVVGFAFFALASEVGVASACGFVGF